MEDGQNVGKTDRFTTLPDAIVPYILSMVHLIDLVRVGCVSQRCKNLILLVPSLNLDGNATTYKRSKLLNQLDRFLLKRGDSKIERMRIGWCFKGAGNLNEKYRINTWIQKAVECNVKELELLISVNRGTEFALEADLFRSSTVRILKVELNGTILKVPAYAVPSNLQHLKLRNVIICNELMKWMSCMKSLKELQLEFVYGIEDIIIESSSLVSFHLLFVCPRIRLTKILISGDKLEDIDISGPYALRAAVDTLDIVASNLKRLRLTGYLMNQITLGSFTCLEKAELFLYPTPNDHLKLFEVLCSVRGIKFLHLDSKTLQVTIEHSLYGTSPSMFYELHPNRGVYLYRGHSLGPFERVSEQAPASKYKKCDWRSQNLACIDHLTEIHLDLSNGAANGIELSLYIIEDAKNLKKMVIIYSHRQTTSMRMINASRVTYSNAQIIFYKKKKRGESISRTDLV